MLVIVLQADQVFGRGVPVEVADGLVGIEVRCAQLEGVGGRKRVGDVAVVVRDEPLPVGKLGLKERQANGLVSPVGSADGEAVCGVVLRPVGVDDLSQACGRSVGIAESRRNGDEGIACLLIGNMQVLVTEEVKELVLDDWSAEGAAGDPAVQLRIPVGSTGMPVLFLKKKGRGVDPVGAAVAVELPWTALLPDPVLMSICAPLAEPCCASYIEALTRTSCSVSGAGVGSAFPMER